MKVNSHDEVGVLANNFNSYIVSLNNMINEIKIINEKNLEISSSLASTSEESSASFKQIDSNIKSMKEKINILDTDIINFNNLINDVTSNVKKVTEKIIEESSEINESSSAIEEMTASIHNVDKIIDKKLTIIK